MAEVTSQPASVLYRRRFSMEYTFSEEKYRKGVAVLKIIKVAGRDDVLVEKLINLGPKAHGWLLTMRNKCFMYNKIPTIGRQFKFIAPLNHGKDSAIPKCNFPLVSQVQTLRKNDTDQISTNHRITP